MRRFEGVAAGPVGSALPLPPRQENRMRTRNLLILVCLMAELVLPAALGAQARPDSAAGWIAIDPEYTLYVDVPAGRIVIALSKKLALNHVRQMKILAREHYFDGLPFHRVIGGFVAQAGDMATEPKDLGSAAKSLEPRFDEPWSEDLRFVPLSAPDEYQEQTGFIDGFPAMRSLSENRVWLTGCPGMVGMPRDDDPKSAAAGFAIALGSNRYNDRNGTRFGRVVDGLDIARMMRRANVDDPSTWTLIDSVRVAADLPPELRTPLEIRNTNAAGFAAYLASQRIPDDPWYVTQTIRLDVCTTWIVPTRTPLGGG